MAFAGRFIRQSMSLQGLVSSNGQSPVTSLSSMLNAIRSMSSSKLYIEGLSYRTDDQSLKEAFTNFGDVLEAKVITDRDSGRSRGIGFVSFNDTESASAALSAMDGHELDGRNIHVSYANDRPSAPRGGGGGGGYYGGAGDSSY